MTHSQTAVFRRRVRAHMQPPPVVVPAGLAVGEVVRRMTAQAASVAVVLDADGRPNGILTEQDVTRRIAGRAVDAQPVGTLMTTPLATVAEEQPLYEAIGFMRRLGLRHMPVIDNGGDLVGMLYLHDALAAAAASLVEQIDRLTHEGTLTGLHEVKVAQVQLAADLFADRVPAPEIQGLISWINNDLHRRVVALVLAAMQADGWGAPPVAFCTIVMGSGGRGESFLCPDQDNGFILADYPDEAHRWIDPFFIELAERMTGQLDQLGFPLCRGAVMAINPLWRKSQSQWAQQVRGWVARRSPAALQCCDILFDFQSVFGTEAMAAELRGLITQLSRHNAALLRAMLGIQADHHAAIGWFHRLLTEHVDPVHRGEINLKATGTLPLAEAVRLMALRDGIDVTGTLARIDALANDGRLDRDTCDRLRGAFEHITGLQLRQQLTDYRAGRPVSNFVHPADLTEREIDLLKDSFLAINRFRDELRAELTGELF